MEVVSQKYMGVEIHQNIIICQVLTWIVVIVVNHGLMDVWIQVLITTLLMQIDKTELLVLQRFMDVLILPRKTIILVQILMMVTVFHINMDVLTLMHWILILRQILTKVVLQKFGDVWTQLLSITTHPPMLPIHVFLLYMVAWILVLSITILKPMLKMVMFVLPRHTDVWILTWKISTQLLILIKDVLLTNMDAWMLKCLIMIQMPILM